MMSKHFELYYYYYKMNGWSITKLFKGGKMLYLYPVFSSSVVGPRRCCFLPPRGSLLRWVGPCRKRPRPHPSGRGRRGRGRSWTGCCCARSAARSAPGWWSVIGSGWGRSWRWAGRGRTAEPCRTAPAGERCPEPRNHQRPDVVRRERHHQQRNKEKYLFGRL